MREQGGRGGLRQTVRVVAAVLTEVADAVIGSGGYAVGYEFKVRVNVRVLVLFGRGSDRGGSRPARCERGRERG